MRTHKALIGGLTLSLALAAAPAFSQGLGVGLGSQTKVGVGGGAGAGTGSGAGIGVGSKTEVHAGPEPKSESRSEGRGLLGLGARIESNPQLATKVQGMLPSGSSMNEAASGFKDEGQFLATLHASQNLNIPFEDLKSQMTANHVSSLGAAIKQCRPTMSDRQAKQEARKAEVAAKADAKASATVKN